VYEPQTLAYLKKFHIPEDYQEKIIEYYRCKDSTQGDIEAAKKRLERQLERERDLYRWGDLTEGEYKRRRDDIRRQLDALNPVPSGSDNLPRLAQFLTDVSSAWESATAEQQNKLARALFEEIWIKERKWSSLSLDQNWTPFFDPTMRSTQKKLLKVSHRLESSSTRNTGWPYW